MALYNLQQLAELLQAQLHGDGATEISAVATLETATSSQISFLSNSKYRKFLQQTQASVVLIKADDLPFCPVAALVVPDPYVAFAKVAQLLDSTPAAAYGVHPSATIDATASVDATAQIGPNVVISRGAVIGANVQIGAGTFIGEYAVIADDCKIWANVSIYHRVQIGAKTIVHSGAVLGADGFGFANQRGQWLKIPQVGSVIIGEQCEIGPGTTIDRGAIEDTVIGKMSLSIIWCKLLTTCKWVTTLRLRGVQSSQAVLKLANIAFSVAHAPSMATSRFVTVSKLPACR